MLRLAYAFFVAASLSITAGCSQPCDHDHLCALDSDNALCDGSDYQVCDDSRRNQQVTCTGNKVAVCTPNGWTFQNLP